MNEIKAVEAVNRESRRTEPVKARKPRYQPRRMVSLPQDVLDLGNHYEDEMEKLTGEAARMKNEHNAVKYNVADPVKLMRVDEVRKEYGLTGKGVTVGVIDSGFNYPEAEPVAWKDFVEGADRPFDPHGHGTHVTGDILNIAPGAKFVSLRTAPISGQDKHTDNAKALRWAVQNKEKYGIDIINMSLGDPPQLTPLTAPPYFIRYINPGKQAVEEAVEAGITVVIAAGNDGRRGKYTICEAADDDKAISVASSLNDKTVSGFSSRGLTLEGRDKPDIAAPGENISSWASQGSVMARRSPSPKPGYIISQGTSFASPHVAGVSALLKEADPTLTPAEIKEILQATARPMAVAFGPEDRGAGFVDAKAAVDEVMRRKQARKA